jgi:hypothetical protein
MLSRKQAICQNDAVSVDLVLMAVPVLAFAKPVLAQTPRISVNNWGTSSHFGCRATWRAFGPLHEEPCRESAAPSLCCALPRRG